MLGWFLIGTAFGWFVAFRVRRRVEQPLHRARKALAQARLGKLGLPQLPPPAPASTPEEPLHHHGTAHLFTQRGDILSCYRCDLMITEVELLAYGRHLPWSLRRCLYTDAKHVGLQLTGRRRRPGTDRG